MNRGGEYVWNDFLNLCNTHDIQKKFTTRYTPQENSVAERKNKTIMEMARNKMVTKNFSIEYCDETMEIAI